jgi:8-oxo-dGTP diphosphatase
VAGAVIEDDGRLLLVHNLRRSGRLDWSTPGGVIDPGETILQGLTREVEEETGILVTAWEGPVYEVLTSAPELGWELRVEVHRAAAWHGQVNVGDDPDGIVVDAEFVDLADLAARVDGSQRWVSEPLLSWVAERWTTSRVFRYRVDGDMSDQRVMRE